ASTKAAATPFSMLEPVWLQTTFFPSASSAAQSILLVVVFPLVPQTIKMSPRTWEASSLSISGQMRRAIFPAQVTPCLWKMCTLAACAAFAAQTAAILRNFICLSFFLIYSLYDVEAKTSTTIPTDRSVPRCLRRRFGRRQTNVHRTLSASQSYPILVLFYLLACHKSTAMSAAR